MKVTVLSSKNYEDKGLNYGDCFIIDNGKEVIVYDCGHEEHAKRVISYMEQRDIDKVKVILSHNDSDHFDGILYLIDKKKVEKVYTVLLLKYKDKLLEIIDDGRKTRASITNQIIEKYSNINELGNMGILEEAKVSTEVADGIVIVGPNKEYMLDAFAKALDSTEGDTKDCETIVNATSIQLSVEMNGRKLLLCGDCSFTAIEDKVSEYKYIQLPHHGKVKQAEAIFEVKEEDNETTYIVSDNTGNTNGGSDKLPSKGYDIKNTKNGDIELNCGQALRRTVGSYSCGVPNEIFS